jgi:thioredoxin
MPLEQIDTARFADLVASEPALIVDFYADWCGPCKAIAPQVEALAARFPTVTTVKVDVNEEQVLADAFRIRFMPTFVVFRKGKEVARVEGTAMQAIEMAFEKAAAAAQE